MVLVLDLIVVCITKTSFSLVGCYCIRVATAACVVGRWMGAMGPRFGKLGGVRALVGAFCGRGGGIDRGVHAHPHKFDFLLDFILKTRTLVG